MLFNFYKNNLYSITLEYHFTHILMFYLHRSYLKPILDMDILTFKVWDCALTSNVISGSLHVQTHRRELPEGAGRVFSGGRH